MLTEEEKVMARHHLGYLGVQESATFILGVPAAVQTQFMIELSFHKVMPQAENLFKILLCRCTEVETEVYGGLDYASVLGFGTIQVNPDRLKELGKYYRLAQQGLANLLGIPPNAFDQRQWVTTGCGMNVPVL